MRSHALLDDLKWRGLLYQHTDEVGDALNSGPVTGYIGFDPTAPSLHIGSLLVIMLLVRLQRHGHRPVALVGGGTGLIGDPSGKARERPLSDADIVAANTEAIRKQLERFLDFTGPQRRADDQQRRVARRAARRRVHARRRQALHRELHAAEGLGARAAWKPASRTPSSRTCCCRRTTFWSCAGATTCALQMGGSDQWGNITAGIELIRRTLGLDAHAITSPLVTTSAGTKFGKTEAGAIWLDATMTSPYKFYQFLVNVDDRDAGKYLRYFTLLDARGDRGARRGVGERPEKREAQQALAREVTRLVHGERALAAARGSIGLLFGGVEPQALSRDALIALQAEIPVFTIEPKRRAHDARRARGDAASAPEALFESKGDMRRMLQQGGVYMNGAHRSASLGRLSGEFVLVEGSELRARQASFSRVLARKGATAATCI